YDTECTEKTETINHRDTETQRRWSAEHAEGKRRSVRRPACSAGRHARPDRTETRARVNGDGSRFRPTPVARGASRRRRTEASLYDKRLESCFLDNISCGQQSEISLAEFEGCTDDGFAGAGD